MRASANLIMPGLALLSIAVVMSAGEAFSQQRPGIRPFVTPLEGCSVSDPVETENLYSFTMAQIQALSFARAGERATHGALAGGNSLIEQMPKTMADLRQAQIEDTCAGFVLTPYAGSKNENIATAAKYLAFAYDELGKMTNEMLGITMQSSLRGSVSTRPQLLKLKDKRQEIIQNMNEALNLSLSLLIDQKHTDAQGRPDRLILTHEQKISLTDYLHSRFPTLSDETSIGHSDDFIKQAALIQSFLSGNYTLGTVTATPK